jgi:hypothetical protein
VVGHARSTPAVIAVDSQKCRNHLACHHALLVSQLVNDVEGFAQMLTRVDLLPRFDTDDAAALLYDCVTETPAGTIRTAEFFGLRDGKIANIRLVFDASALRQV